MANLDKILRAGIGVLTVAGLLYNIGNLSKEDYRAAKDPVNYTILGAIGAAAVVRSTYKKEE